MQGSEVIVSKIQRIPRPRQLFPELAAVLIEWKRLSLRSSRTFRLIMGNVPIWVTGSLAGMLGIMLTISLFFIPQPRLLEAAAALPEPVIPAPVQPAPEPQPTLALPETRSNLILRIFATRFPFTWDENQTTARSSTASQADLERLASDLWREGRNRFPAAVSFSSYLARAVGLPASWPGLSASEMVTVPLTAPPLRSMGILLEKTDALRGAPDEPLTYQIVVRNISAAAIENLEIRERISTLARVTDVVPAAGISGDELVWHLDSLGPGNSRTFLVTLVPELEGQIETFTRIFPTSRVSAVVNVRAPLPKPVAPVEPARAITQTPAGAPALQLTYTEVRPLKQGDTLSMIFEVRNVGTASADDVILFVRLSGEFEHRYGEFVKHQVGTLQPGQARRALLQATARDPGEGHLDASLTMQGTQKESRELRIPIQSGAIPSGKQQPVVRRPILDEATRLTVLEPSESFPERGLKAGF